MTSDTISMHGSRKHLVVRKRSDTKECVVWPNWFEILENAVFNSGYREQVSGIQKPGLGVGWTAKGLNETGGVTSILHLNGAADDYICQTQVILHFSCMPFTVRAFIFNKINKLGDSFLHRLICIICIFSSKQKPHSYKYQMLEFVFNGFHYHIVVLKIRQWMVKIKLCLNCQTIIGPQTDILSLRVSVNCLKG